jgi:hypothetical protein
MAKIIRALRGQSILVDDQHFDFLNEWTWLVRRGRFTDYAFLLNHPPKLFPEWPFRVAMHRLILGLAGTNRPIIDHKDGNGLNNQEGNLRIATYSQNNWNRRKQAGTSQYKGVCWYPRYNKWLAQLRANSKRHHLGYFDTEEEAYEAYCRAAEKLHGEFARTV